MTGKLQYTVVDGIRCYSLEKANSYSDYPAGGFDLTQDSSANSFWVRSRNRLFKKLIEKFSPQKQRIRLFEVGCGTGDFLAQLASAKTLEITGSEIYVKGLLYAKMNLPEVSFVQYDVTQGHIDERFDVIAAFDVLEHIEDDVAALSNMHQMLGGGGVLIVSVPQHMSMWSELDELVKHKRRYSRVELTAKLRQTGYEIRYVTSFVFTLFPAMYLSRLLKQRRSPSVSDDAALEKIVTFSKPANLILDAFMRLDELLIRLGISLPFGGTLIVVAFKP